MTWFGIRRTFAALSPDHLGWTPGSFSTATRSLFPDHMLGTPSVPCFCTPDHPRPLAPCRQFPRFFLGRMFATSSATCLTPRFCVFLFSPACPWVPFPAFGCCGTVAARWRAPPSWWLGRFRCPSIAETTMSHFSLTTEPLFTTTKGMVSETRGGYI